MSDYEREADDDDALSLGSESAADQTGDEASPDLLAEGASPSGGASPGDDDEGDLGDLDLPPPGPSMVPGLPGDFKENWAMLACCVGVFIACMWLPIEGGVLDLHARDSIAGGFLTVFAGYGIVGCIFNILHRKMIVLPAVMMAFDGLYVAIRRLIQLMDQVPEGAAGRDYMTAAGSGLWIILGCSFWVFITLFKSAASGRAREQERKDVAKAAKQTAKQAARRV